MFLNRPLCFHKTTIDTWSSSLQFCQVIFTTSVNTFSVRGKILGLWKVFLDVTRSGPSSSLIEIQDTGHKICRMLECMVTTVTVPRKLAEYRALMTAAVFWSHSAPAPHMSSPGRTLESHPAVKVSAKFRRNNIWKWCLTGYSTLLKAPFNIVFTRTNV